MTRTTTRSTISILAISILVIAVAPATVAATDVAVSNPGFEQLEPSGTVGGWRLVTEVSSDGASFGAEGELVHSGVGSARLAVKGHGTVTAESDPVALEVGKLYRLSGWIRTEGVVSDPMSKYPTAVPTCLTMEALPFTIHSPAVGGDSDWFRVDLLFIATSASDRVRLHLGYNGTARGTAWFDDVRIEKVEDITEYIPLETVRWSGPGFRYDDQGWIFVHIEGEPYERGYQYGSLMPDEIAEYIRKLGVVQYRDDPEAGWDTIRFEADALFLRKYDDEYLTEMKGIADGAAAAGGEAWGRPIDLRDIVAINSVVDIGQLYDALEVTPNSLTGQAFTAPDEELDIEVEQHKCSAFVATGPATRDGDIVFGQIFMWSGYTGMHWNVITDVATVGRIPARLPHLPGRHPFGRRFLSQRGRHRLWRDHRHADAVRGELDAAVQPRPQGGPVRRLDRRRRADPVGEEQRNVHQRLADRRLQDRRGGHPAPRDPHQEDVADLRGHGSLRHPRLPVGQQQQPRPRGPQGVRCPAGRPAVRPHVFAVEPGRGLQRVLPREQGQDRRQRRCRSCGPRRPSTAPTPATARSPTPRWPTRWCSLPTTAR